MGDNKKENMVIAVDFPLGKEKNSTINWLISINSYESLITLKDIHEKFGQLKKFVDFNPVYFFYRKTPKSATTNQGEFHKPKESEDEDGFTHDISEEC